MAVCFFKNAFVNTSEATISPFDSGFSRGLAVNEFIPVFRGMPFYLDAHLHRLMDSMQMTNLLIPLDNINQICSHLIEVNRIVEGYIKIFVVGGNTSDLLSHDSPYLMVFAQSPRPSFPALSKVKTVVAKRTLPLCKTNNYLEGCLAQNEALQKGFTDALMVHKGKLKEAPTANFFAVINGQVVTPKSEILPGVTRAIILQLSGGVETELFVDEIGAFDEAFLTSSSRPLTPVLQINQYSLTQKVGPVTRHLLDLFNRHVQEVICCPL